MAEEHTNTRKITLREFKPDSYKVWEMSTKATLKFNKLFDIVDGSEPDPTPRTNDGAIRRPINAAVQARIDKWHHDYERAREAIIRCLPDAELLKLDDVQEDVTAIWKRLQDEYGQPSNLEYVRASNELTLLKKDERTSINDHINKFEQLVYEVNYNKPTDTRNMEESVVNLKFLNTLMTNESTREKWETFINAKGPQLEKLSTQQLYAEVRVSAKISPTTLRYDDEVRALTTSIDLHQAIRDLNSRIDSLQHSNHNTSEKRRERNGNCSRKSRQRPEEDENVCEGCKNPDHDIEDCPLFCGFCKENGHIIDDCLKRRWANEQRPKRLRDTGNRWRTDNYSSSKRPRSE